MIREALASQADTAIVPAQDLLGLGSEARMNSPGIAKGYAPSQFAVLIETNGHGQESLDYPGIRGRVQGRLGGPE
jgi:hypothetical protein